jgi:hypothetical protein
MAAAKTAGGPQEYDNGTMFVTEDLDPNTRAHAKAMSEARQSLYAALAPELAARLRKGNEMQDTDVAVGWRDPKHRIVGLEFQAADGSPLHYNHNGYFHSERPDEQKGFDVYDLRAPLPADARLVCWLLTEYSVVPAPLKVADLPLPPVPAPATPSPTAGAQPSAVGTEQPK